MAKQRGKVKAVPVQEVRVGMQVLLFGGSSPFILRIAENRKGHEEGYDDDDEVSLTYAQGNIDDLKTLVVEYESDEKLSRRVTSIYNPKVSEVISFNKKEQIPVKYSQWKSSVNNGEVNSDKIVKFDIITVFPGTDNSKTETYEYAKIIPEKKKKYTEEQVVFLVKKAIAESKEAYSLLDRVGVDEWLKQTL